MIRRPLLPLALLVAALLGVAAVAARGRPLGGGTSGGGVSLGYLNYVFTAGVLVVVASLLVGLWLIYVNRSALQPFERARRNRWAAAVFLALLTALFWGLTTKHFLKRFRQWEKRLHLTQRQSQGQNPSNLPSSRGHKGGRAVELRWDEVGIVLALLAALGVAGYAVRRRRPGALPSWQLASQAAVSEALDESLDDLRSEPDLRKAIIAAYARMERALAIAGLPRRPSEAPLEYLGRALGELETSADAIRRLTDLFEWAKFSQHEPDPSMRDDAIDALVAVRDELRAPAATAEPLPA
jgi:hypothetical protein